MTVIKKMPKGAKNTICSSDLTATRLELYSLSPPKRLVHITTYEQ
jgi:hypothetical protein